MCCGQYLPDTQMGILLCSKFSSKRTEKLQEEMLRTGEQGATGFGHGFPWEPTTTTLLWVQGHGEKKSAQHEAAAARRLGRRFQPSWVAGAAAAGLRAAKRAKRCGQPRRLQEQRCCLHLPDIPQTPPYPHPTRSCPPCPHIPGAAGRKRGCWATKRGCWATKLLFPIFSLCFYARATREPKKAQDLAKKHAKAPGNDVSTTKSRGRSTCGGPSTKLSVRRGLLSPPAGTCSPGVPLCTRPCLIPSFLGYRLPLSIPLRNIHLDLAPTSIPLCPWTLAAMEAQEGSGTAAPTPSKPHTGTGTRWHQTKEGSSLS